MNNFEKKLVILKLVKSEKIAFAQDDTALPDDWLNNENAPQYDISVNHSVLNSLESERQINIVDVEIKFEQLKTYILDNHKQWIELKSGDLIVDALSKAYEVEIVNETKLNQPIVAPLIATPSLPKAQHLDIWGDDESTQITPVSLPDKNTDRKKTLNSALKADVHGYHQLHDISNISTVDSIDRGIIPTNIPSQLAPVNPGLNSALSLDPISSDNQLTLNQQDAYSLVQTGQQDSILGNQNQDNGEGNILRDLGISQDVVVNTESASSSSPASKNFMQQTPLDLIDDIWQEDASHGYLNANALVDAKTSSTVPSIDSEPYHQPTRKKEPALFLQRLKNIAHKIIN